MASSTSILGIVQARMNSGRLPGKVLMPLLDRSLVCLHVERLSRSRLISQVVVATSDSPADDVLVDHLRSQGIAFFRGSETDVLDRFAQCTNHFRADVVTRTTADCPMIDPDYADALIEYFLNEQQGQRHAAISLQRIPRGFDTEVFYASALHEAALQATDPYEREHVTPYLYRNVAPGASIQFLPSVEAGDLRLCVDEPADYEMMRELAARFGSSLAESGLDQIVDFLRDNPDIPAINASVQQR